MTGARPAGCPHAGDHARPVLERPAELLLVSDGVTVTFASPATHRTLGYAPGGLVGMPVSDLLHENDAGLLRSLSRSVPNAVLHLRLACADGGHHPSSLDVTGGWGPEGTLSQLVFASRETGRRASMEAALRRSERRFRDALDASTDGFAMYRIRRGRNGEQGGDGAATRFELIFMNRAGSDRFDGDAGPIEGRDVRDLFPTAVESRLWQTMLAAAADDAPKFVRVENTGPPWPGVLDVRAVRLGPDTLLTTWHDVTAELRRERQLTAAHAETSELSATLQTALDATSDAFAVYALERDDDGRLDRLRLLLANVAAAAPMNLQPADLVGLDVRDLFDQAVSSGLWEVILESVDEMSPRHFRVHVLDERGEWLSSWDNTIAPVGRERVVVTWRDATTDEKAVRELALAHDNALYVAEHDALTGLPNRRLMLTRLAAALEELTEGEQVAVVFVDLDDFKAINDTWGHAAGDEVLKAVGRRLSRIVRHGDTASRLAGDEFVLVLRYLQPDWDAELFFRRAQAMVSAPVEIRGLKVMPHASMGLALSPPEEADVDRLIQLADAAMYATKTSHRSSAPDRWAPDRWAPDRWSPPED